jgi:lipoprotein-anchoring transpeptidase ErfK/SrfK
MKYLLLIICLACSAIAADSAPKAQPKGNTFDNTFYRWDPNTTNITKIVIKRTNLDGVMTPILYAYTGDELMGWAYCSPGKASTKTTNGTHKIMGKTRDRNSSKYGESSGGYYYPAKMPFAMQVTASGEFIHYGPVLISESLSHGCIRLASKAFAEKLFNATSVGTPVIIEL